jgi:acetyl esterase/lipase
MARGRCRRAPAGFPPPGGSRPPGPALPLVRDLSTADDGRPGLPLRLHRPATEPRPLVLYLHGGGFVLGDLESHDNICRRLTLIADVAVLAVDYRRAPEHPGPAAVDDAVTVFGWAQGRPDELGAMAAAGIGLAGDSAGGTLARLMRAAGVDVSLVPHPGLGTRFPWPGPHLRRGRAGRR